MEVKIKNIYMIKEEKRKKIIRNIRQRGKSSKKEGKRNLQGR